MRVTRLLPVGLLAATAVGGVVCGRNGIDVDSNAPAETSSATTMSKKHRIEGFVEREDYVDQKATDEAPHLLNAWGLVFGPDGLGWSSSNGTGKITAFDSAGVLRHEIQSPRPKGVREVPAPTGIVWNFDHDAFKGEDIIFVTEGGTVASADRDDIVGTIRWVSHAVYKGCAIATVHGKSFLYATDFVGGKIDVFDEHFHPVKVKTGGFADKNLDANFEPFNIMTVDGDKLLVTYALKQANGEDDVAGPGNGFVDLFAADGRLIARLISHGALNSPWGMALAPEERDDHSIDLLVGNFGDGHINVYDISSKKGKFEVDFEGQLGDVDTGKPLFFDGLWALVFGKDLGGFEVDNLYFTAGPNDEADGVFGELSFVGPRRSHPTMEAQYLH